MRQNRRSATAKSETRATPEQIVKDIRRATRKHHSAEEKIRIVLKGLRGEYSIAKLCQREGIAESLYYTAETTMACSCAAQWPDFTPPLTENGLRAFLSPMQTTSHQYRLPRTRWSFGVMSDMRFYYQTTMRQRYSRLQVIRFASESLTSE